MRKLLVFLLFIGLILTACGKEGESGLDKKIENLILKETDEINMFLEAVNRANEVEGIVDMSEPHYSFTIGEDSYYLWIDEESGTIMNQKDSHKIYTLTEDSHDELYKFLRQK